MWFNDDVRLAVLAGLLSMFSESFTRLVPVVKFFFFNRNLMLLQCPVVL